MLLHSEQPPADDRTWQKRLLVLTLIVALLFESLFTMVSILITPIDWVTGLVFVQTAGDLFLLIQLVRSWKDVFAWITWRAVSLWLFWMIIVAYEDHDVIVGFFVAVLLSGVSLPLLLLAAGRPGRWRLFLALLSLVVYIIFLGLLVWMILHLDVID